MCLLYDLRNETACQSPLSNSTPAFGPGTWRPAWGSYLWVRRPTSSTQWVTKKMFFFLFAYKQLQVVLNIVLLLLLFSRTTGERKHSATHSSQSRTDVTGRAAGCLRCRPRGFGLQRKDAHRLCKVTLDMFFLSFHLVLVWKKRNPESTAEVLIIICSFVSKIQSAQYTKQKCLKKRRSKPKFTTKLTHLLCVWDGGLISLLLMSDRLDDNPGTFSCT